MTCNSPTARLVSHCSTTCTARTSCTGGLMTFTTSIKSCILDNPQKQRWNTLRGIQWTLMQKLEDLDFADDVSLFSHKVVQFKTTRLCNIARTAGLEINVAKPGKPGSPPHCWWPVHQDIDHFTYLRSIVSKTGGTEEGIKARINKAFKLLPQ